MDKFCTHVEARADDGYASHELIEQVSHLLDTFDAIGGQCPAWNEALAFNLGSLATLAAVAADHVRARHVQWLADEAEWAEFLDRMKERQ